MRIVIVYMVVLMALAGMNGCAVSSSAVQQVGTAVTQTAAYQSAKLTVDKYAAKLGLTPQQTAQVLPMLQDYYTTMASAVQNTSGSASQKATAAKNALVAKLKTVLTAQQVTQAIGLL